ncbi:MAG: dihydrofolate reductase [Saprospiraceae bacterium]|nr:MAG: dihydrofolate reductase [Saprospiraceae bacterium]
MIVSAIVATAKKGVIGKDNDIPWYLPADLKYFKRTTLNHHIIMGRNCFASIGRPLPKRTNIVISRNPYFVASNALVARSIEEALSIAEDHGEEEAFIIGGGQIYESSMPFWDRLYLTEVDLEVEGDVFFPEIKPEAWQLVSEEAHQPDEKNEHAYIFKVLERLSK